MTNMPLVSRKLNSNASRNSETKMPSAVGPEPKKPLPAYNLFNIEYTAELRAAKPKLSEKEIKSTVWSGEEWNYLSDAHKQLFKQLEEIDKKLYEARMDEWISNGVFEFEDGSLSTDPKNLDRI